MTKQRRAVQIFINGKAVAKELSTMRKEGQRLQRQFKQLEEGTPEYNAKAKEIEQFNERLRKQEQKLLKLGKAIRLNGKVVANELQAIQEEANIIETALGKMKEGSEEYIKKSKELATVNELLEKHEKELLESGEAIKINGKLVVKELRAMQREAKQVERAMEDMEEGTEEFNKTAAELKKANQLIAEQEEEWVKSGKAVRVNGRVIQKTIKALRAEARRLNAILEKATISQEEYNQTARELEEINKILDKHTKEVEQIKGAWVKIKSGIDKYIGLAAAAFTADAVITYGKELFRMGVEMDTLGRKAQTVFGHALPLVTAQAEQNASAMGLTTTQYTNAAAAIGDLLIPMGFTREEAARSSTALVDLSGALSEWTGGQKSAEEVTKILGKAILGEREELKSLGISIQEADVKARLAEKGLDKLTGQMLQQAKAAATLELITEKSADAQAAYAANSDSLIRRQAELRAKLTDVAERLAKALLPVFERLIGIVEIFVNGLGRLSENFLKLESPVERAKSSVYQLQSAFNSEVNTLKELNPESEQRAKLIEEINSRYSTYLPKLLSEKSTLEDIEKAQTAANNAFQQKILMISFEDEIQQLGEEYKRLTKLTAEAEMTAARFAAGEFNDLENALRDSPFASQRQDFQEYANALGSGQVQENLLKQTEALEEQKQKITDSYEALAERLGTSLQAIFNRFKTASVSATETQGPSEEEIKEQERLQQHLERLQEMVERFREEARIAELGEEEQRIERIRQRYQKQIDVAKELEAQGMQEATAQRLELERLRDEEIRNLRTELANQAIDEDLERQAQQDEEETLAFLEKERKKAEAQEQIDAELRSAREQAVLDLEDHFNNLEWMAKEYGIDTTELEKKRREEMEKLNKEFDKKEQKALDDSIKKRLQAQQAMFKAFGDLVTSALSLLADEGSEFAVFQKAATLAQIAMDTAAAISALTANSEKNPTNSVTFGAAGAAQFISGLARILANMAQAKKVLNGAEIPQRKEGGYFDVIGEDDKQKYHAQFIGSQPTGLLPAHPVVLASEAGAEYFVSHRDLQNPQIADYVRIIDNISKSRGGIPQRKEGGFTQEPVATTTTPAPVEKMEVMRDLSDQLSRLNDHLDNGLHVQFEDDDIVRLIRRYGELEELSGGRLEE